MVTGGAGSYRSLITSRDDPAGADTRGYVLYASAVDRWEFWTGSGGTTAGWDVLNGPTVTLNQWTHVVMTFDASSGPDANGTYGGTKTLFVDGAQVAQAAGSFYRPNEFEDVHLGAGADTGNTFFFPGNIDEVAIYDSLLSPAEVASHYNTAQSSGLLTNDFDADFNGSAPDDTLTILELNGVGGTAPFAGTSMLGAQVTLRADGSYDYDPTSAAALQVLSAGEILTDQFAYTVTDGSGGTDTATVSIAVTSTDNVEINTNHDFVFQPATAPPNVDTPITPGLVAGADTVQVDLTGGNLEIRVNGQLLRTTPLTTVDIEIVGSTQDDNVILNGLGGGDIDVQGGGGTDSLTINDSADTTDDTIAVTTTNITGLIDGGGTLTHTAISNIDLSLGSGNDTVDMNDADGGAVVLLDVTGNAGDDTFEMTTNQTTSIVVHGEDPTAPTGDTLILNLDNVEPPIVFPGTTDGSFTSSGLAGANLDVIWTGIESFIFDGQPFIAGDLFVSTTPDQDRVVISNGGGGRVLTRINNVFYGPFAVTGTVVVYGQGGNDTITMAGNVSQCGELHGGDGRDYIAGGVCGDTIFGDSGNDTLLTGNGDNTVYGGTGSDSISGRSGNDTLIGQDGNDRLIGGSGSDVLIGDDLNDLLAIGSDQLSGGNGDDLLVGGFGNDTLGGGAGNDVLIGNGGDDFITGDRGDDLIIGGAGADLLYGQNDIDRIADGVAANEEDEASLLLLLAEWTGPATGLDRPYTNAGVITAGDGDIDLLSGEASADALRFGGEDQAILGTGDVLF